MVLYGVAVSEANVQVDTQPNNCYLGFSYLRGLHFKAFETKPPRL